MKQVASRTLLLAALAFSGAFATHAYAEGAAAVAEPTDEQLAAVVKQALDADPELKALDLKVSSKKGEVTIEGQMNEDQQMFKAGQIAEQVPGVKFVINKMEQKG
ncbi:BON domain-containing protein [Chromobacterium sp. IIBBL 290-4]|uniref:BON domain-containing protein n=1 Tax=Chromobacterium sp. IIBBL 290-4 TaxID=2953890 RepID=UPI0020B8D25C|nr:BON domain-containing protein [Chromobacterium sp. IIBBL 290-4]UTH72343.1 BON domain-containing protein [Chromobacterium sp. IIBBL 290-4]